MLLSRRLLFLLAGVSTGCVEHWYAYDDASIEVIVDGQALVDARVTTQPDAWPDEEVYGRALRVGMDGHEVSLVGEVLEDGTVDSQVPNVTEPEDGVNVLSAWRGCDRYAVCERTFRFQAVCGGGEPRCEGLFEGDAFISIFVPPVGELPEGEGLSLEFSLPQP